MDPVGTALMTGPTAQSGLQKMSLPEKLEVAIRIRLMDAPS